MHSMGEEPSMGTSDLSSGASEPVWLGKLEQWMSVRLRSEELSTLDSPYYRKYLLNQVLKLRSQCPIETEFLEVCRVTGWFLLLRAQLIIAGLERGMALPSIVKVTYGFLSDYPSYVTESEATIDAVPIHALGKMFLFEGEMFSLIISHTSKEALWFKTALEETQSAASKHWNEVITALNARAVPSVVQGTKLFPQIRLRQSTLPIFGVLICTGWAWNARFMSSDTNAGYALGSNIVTVGLPLLLLWIISRALVRRLTGQGVLKAKELVWAFISATCSLMAFLDLMDDKNTHGLGATLCVLGFACLCVFLFRRAYRQQRSAPVT